MKKNFGKITLGIIAALAIFINSMIAVSSPIPEDPDVKWKMHMYWNCQIQGHCWERCETCSVVQTDCGECDIPAQHECMACVLE